MRHLVNARDLQIWHIADFSTFHGSFAEEGGCFSDASLYQDSSEDEFLEAFLRDEDQGADFGTCNGDMGIAYDKGSGREGENYFEAEHRIEGDRGIAMGRSKQSSDVLVKRKRGRPRKERPQKNAQGGPQNSIALDIHAMMEDSLQPLSRNDVESKVSLSGDEMAINGTDFRRQEIEEGLGAESNAFKSRRIRSKKLIKFRDVESKKCIVATAGIRTVEEDACEGNGDLKQKEVFLSKRRKDKAITMRMMVSEKIGSIERSKYGTGIVAVKEEYKPQKNKGELKIFRGFLTDKRQKVRMKGADKNCQQNTKRMPITREEAKLASKKPDEHMVVTTEELSSDGGQKMQRKAGSLLLKQETFNLGASDDSNATVGVDSAGSTKDGLPNVLEHVNSSRGQSGHLEAVRSSPEVINKEQKFDIKVKHPAVQEGNTVDCNAGGGYLQVKELCASLGSVQSIAGGKDVENGVVAEEVSSCVTEGGDGNKGHSLCEKRDDSDDAELRASDVGWVLCDDCHKWRCIPAELADVIEATNCRWSCPDNPDKDFADCSLPQEKSNAEINAELNISEVSFCEEGDDNNAPVDSDDDRQAVWTLIKHNKYLHRQQKMQTIDEVMVCQCKPSNDGRPGCGDECLNRMLSIECVADTCPCSELCSNQQFQKRVYVKVGWYRCGKKGFGLQVLEDVCKGTFIIEYVGEVLDRASYEARQKDYACRGQKHFYFMTLNSDEVIDASVKGNLGRFINHSCEPNCVTEKWMVNGEVCIGLFAIRDLEKGEEITFDYNFVRVCGAAAKKCCCGSSVCRGFIGGDPTTPLVVVESESDEEDPEPIMIEEPEEQEETLVDDGSATAEKKQGENRDSQHPPTPRRKWTQIEASQNVSNRVKTISLRKSGAMKGLSVETNGGRFEGVEEKLNELLDENGGIGRRKDAGMHYLKLLLMTAASGDAINGEASRRTRDLSMVLDALLKTLHRSVLADIINKNGMQILHNMLKQNRRNYKRTPIIRKLLKVLEFLAAKNILTFEHINSRPLHNKIESIRDTIVLLSRHSDGEVQQIARRFRDKWLPRELYVGHSSSYTRHTSENSERFYSRHQHHYNWSFPEASVVLNQINKDRKDETISEQDASQRYQHQSVQSHERTRMVSEQAVMEKKDEIIAEQNVSERYQNHFQQSHPYEHSAADNQNTRRENEISAERNAALRCQNKSDQFHQHAYLVTDHINMERKGIADQNTFSVTDMDAANLKPRRKSRWDEDYKPDKKVGKLNHVAFAGKNINTLISASISETHQWKSGDAWEHQGSNSERPYVGQQKGSTLLSNLQSGDLKLPESSCQKPSIQQRLFAGFDPRPASSSSEMPVAVNGVPIEQFVAVTPAPAPAGALPQQTPVCYGIPVDAMKPLSRSHILESNSPGCSVPPFCNQDALQRSTSNRLSAKQQQMFSLQDTSVETKGLLFGIPHAQFFQQMQCIFGPSFHPMHVPLLMAPHSWGPYFSIDLQPFHEETEEPEPPVPGLSPPHDLKALIERRGSVDRVESACQAPEPLNFGLSKWNGSPGATLNLRSTKSNASLAQLTNALKTESSKLQGPAANSPEVRSLRWDGFTGSQTEATEASSCRFSKWQGSNGPRPSRFHGRNYNSIHRQDSFPRKHNKAMQTWQGGSNRFCANNFQRQNLSSNNFQRPVSSSSRGRNWDSVQHSGRCTNGPSFTDQPLHNNAKELHAGSLPFKNGGFGPTGRGYQKMSGQFSYNGCSIKDDRLQKNEEFHHQDLMVKQPKDGIHEFAKAVTGDACGSICQSNLRYFDGNALNACMEEVQAVQEAHSLPAGNTFHVNEAQTFPYSPHSHRSYEEHCSGVVRRPLKNGAAWLGSKHKGSTRECLLPSYSNSMLQDRHSYDALGNNPHTNDIECLGRSTRPETEFKREGIEKGCQGTLKVGECGKNYQGSSRPETDFKREGIQKGCQGPLKVSECEMTYQDGLSQLNTDSHPPNHCEDEWIESPSLPDTTAHCMNLSGTMVMDNAHGGLDPLKDTICTFEINNSNIPSSCSGMEIVPQDNEDIMVNAACLSARWTSKKGSDLSSVDEVLYVGDTCNGGMEAAGACLGDSSEKSQGCSGYIAYDSWKVCHGDFHRDEMHNFFVSDEEGFQQMNNGSFGSRDGYNR